VQTDKARTKTGMNYTLSWLQLSLFILKGEKTNKSAAIEI
jgi:hypothetical protein